MNDKGIEPRNQTKYLSNPSKIEHSDQNMYIENKAKKAKETMRKKRK